MKRRNFIKNSALAGMGIMSGKSLTASSESIQNPNSGKKPIVVSTWNVQKSNAAAWRVLGSNGYALDAVEKGVMVEEADPKGASVGIGGRPDRDGHVTLDACIMNDHGNAGSVVFMQDIIHAISVARKVMEETPHVILAGTGATQFALESGFEKSNLLTPDSEKAWKKWLNKSEYEPIINIENHDTIGMIALDSSDRLSGACTTSGLAYKMHGRVGDSPIIGSGLFVDNEVGAATATGLGEEVLKTVGSFLMVELMRQGATPQEACEEGIRRIVHGNKNHNDFQVGYISLDKNGNYGSFSIHPGFWVTVTDEDGTRNFESASYLKKSE